MSLNKPVPERFVTIRSQETYLPASLSTRASMAETGSCCQLLLTGKGSNRRFAAALFLTNSNLRFDPFQNFLHGQSVNSCSSQISVTPAPLNQFHLNPAPAFPPSQLLLPGWRRTTCFSTVLDERKKRPSVECFDMRPRPIHQLSANAVNNRVIRQFIDLRSEKPICRQVLSCHLPSLPDTCHQ